MLEASLLKLSNVFGSHCIIHPLSGCSVEDGEMMKKKFFRMVKGAFIWTEDVDSVLFSVKALWASFWVPLGILARVSLEETGSWCGGFEDSRTSN